MVKFLSVLYYYEILLNNIQYGYVNPFNNFDI